MNRYHVYAVLAAVVPLGIGLILTLTLPLTGFWVGFVPCILGIIAAEIAWSATPRFWHAASIFPLLSATVVVPAPAYSDVDGDVWVPNPYRPGYWVLRQTLPLQTPARNGGIPLWELELLFGTLTPLASGDTNV